MDDMLKLASELGRKIADGPRFKALRDAENAVEQDKDSHELLKSAEEQRTKIAMLEARQEPVSPEDKHKMRDLNEAVRASDRLNALIRAQADYMELMNRVNAAIRKELE